MLGLTKKYLEIILFICINLLFTSNSLLLLLIMLISKFLSVLFFNANPIYENDYPFIIFCLLIGLFCLILKIILFPILYKFKNQFPYTHKFFNFIFSKNKYIISCFFVCLMLLIFDAFITMLLFKNMTWGYFFIETFGFGLIPSYLIMLTFLKLQKQKE